MADGAACVSTERTLVEILIDRIDPDLHQPRGLPRDDEPKLREAVADILATLQVEKGEPVNGRGVREPLKVRRNGERFEIIDGERRWHAARLAGLRRALCEILVLSAEEVLEEQLRRHGVELTPLEEARALARLRDEHKLDLAEIAARTGRGVRLVRQRLALLGLVDEVQAALAGGRITLGVALDLATLAPEAQREAIEPIEREHRGGEPVGLERARWHVERRRLHLAGGGFDIADKSLPGGSCLVCPKRTGVQSELFADGIEHKDQCGDLKCFEQKKAITAKEALARVQAMGIPVVTSAAELKKLFVYGGRQVAHDAPAVDLDERCDLVKPPKTEVWNEGRSGGPDKCTESAHAWEGPCVREDEESEEDLPDDRPAAEAGCEAWMECPHCGAWRECDPPAHHRAAPRGWKPPTWREVLGDALSKVQGKAVKAEATLAAQAPDGTVRELVDRKAALRTLVQAGVIEEKVAKTEIREATPKPPGAMEKWQIENEVAEVAAGDARAQIALRAEKKKPDDVKIWRLLASLILCRSQPLDLLEPAAERRRESTAPKGTKPGDELRSWVAAQKDHGPVRGLVFELLTADTYGEDCQLAIACRAFDVDLEALKKTAASEVKRAAKEKAKKAEERAKAAEAKAAKKASKAPAPVVVEDRDTKPAKGSGPACVVCGRTEDRACEGGCAWADTEATICTCCAEVRDGLLDALDRQEWATDDAADILGDMFGEEPWWKVETATKVIEHAKAKGLVRESAGMLQLVPETSDEKPAAAPEPEPAEECPISWEAVASLAKIAGVPCKLDGHGVGPGEISPANVWRTSRKILATIAEAHPKEVARAALLAQYAVAGADCIDVACALLVGERQVHRAGGTKASGWKYSLKNPPLLATEESAADKLVRLAVQAAGEGCSRKAVLLRLKALAPDAPAGDRDAAITAAITAGKLVEKAGVISAAGAP